MSKMNTIKYNSWAEMLKERDKLNTDYIRIQGNGRYEVVRYSRWNEEIYFAYCGESADTVEELLEKLNPNVRNRITDICIYDK